MNLRTNIFVSLEKAHSFFAPSGQRAAFFFLARASSQLMRQAKATQIAPIARICKATKSISISFEAGGSHKANGPMIIPTSFNPKNCCWYRCRSIYQNLGFKALRPDWFI
jgi:hypothetical protein